MIYYIIQQNKIVANK